MATAARRMALPSRKLVVVLIRFWPFLLLIVASPFLQAQDEPVHMRPEFPLIFPLEQNNRDVTVKYPVLISPTTILKPGMKLRVLYTLNRDVAGSSNLALAHAGTMEQSYARNAFGEGSSLPPELAHELEGYRRTIWEVPNNFVLAMAQYPTDTMHLIYTPTDKNTDLHDERFSFFDGLFVGAPGGKVTVIAVEKLSKTEKAGLKAGDEIVSVGGIPTHDDLATFASAYAAAKKTAVENEVASYPMTIRSGGNETTVNISMPPKIKSGLMNDFFDQRPTPTPKPAPTPAPAQ